MTRAVLRLRSDIKAHREVKETLRHLRLNRVNHCILLPDGKTYDGMLQKVKDYVTWGEIKPEVLTNLIIRRGRLTGERPITNQYVKENSKHESLVKFAEAVAAGRHAFGDLKDAKPVFRLHPPRKGLEGIKRSYKDKGSLGYRGAAINDLILRMLDAPSPGKEAKAPAKSPAKAVPKKAKASPVAKKVPVKKAPAKAPAKKKPTKEASE